MPGPVGPALLPLLDKPARISVTLAPGRLADDFVEDWEVLGALALPGARFRAPHLGSVTLPLAVEIGIREHRYPSGPSDKSPDSLSDGVW